MVHTHVSVVLVIDVAQYLMTSTVSISLLQNIYGSNLNNEQLVNRYIEVRENTIFDYIFTRLFVYMYCYVHWHVILVTLNTLQFLVLCYSYWAQISQGRS